MKKIALALVAFAFLVSLSMLSLAEDKSQKLDGWVTDSKCASQKGAEATHAACAKKCADAGMALVFVSDKNKTVYKIDNQDAVKGHEGHHVNVAGTVTGENIHVDKLSMLEQPKAAN